MTSRRSFFRGLLGVVAAVAGVRLAPKVAEGAERVITLGPAKAMALPFPNHYVSWGDDPQLRPLLEHQRYVNEQIANYLATRPIAPIIVPREGRYVERDGDVFERINVPGVPEAQCLINRTAQPRRQIEALRRQARPQPAIVCGCADYMTCEHPYPQLVNW